MNKLTFGARKWSMLLLASSILVAAPNKVMSADFDGDNKEDTTVHRAIDTSLGTESVWYVLSTALNGTLRYQWGLSGDVPVPGHYSGGLGSDIAVFRPSNGSWYIRKFTTDLSFNQSLLTYQWGLNGDTPMACNFDTDSKSDMVVYRPSNGVWYVRNSVGNTVDFDKATTRQWGGLPDDVPFPDDYDMDNKCDYTIYRNGSWLVLLSSTNSATAANIPWGGAGDVPVPGHYDGDTILDFAVFRPSSALWLIRLSTIAGLTHKVIQWGLPGDVAVPADYTGDNKTDIAVFRPSNGTHYILTSESNYSTAVVRQFGLPTDTPVTN
jgi:hypothetical protein